jgi:hypothetical protein
VDIRGVLVGRDTADFAGATLKREPVNISKGSGFDFVT